LLHFSVLLIIAVKIYNDVANITLLHNSYHNALHFREHLSQTVEILHQEGNILL